MVIKREVAYGIVRGLSEFWNCEELQDFTVTVGETKFGCHKLLLAACSGFFRALFRSGMKETKENCVILEAISSETFQLILETIYTGRGILTNDNVIEIWKAASQLQVVFMIDECEKFVLNSLSLENHAKYFCYGRILSSKIVTETIWAFILKHCNSFFNSSYFLELSFCDLLSLIKSQYLETSSEDEVLKAILKWVEYKPDNDLYNDDSEIGQQVTNESNHSKSSDIKGDGKESSGCYNKDLSEKITTELQQKDDANYMRTLVTCSNIVSRDTSASCDKIKKMEGSQTESNNRKQYLFKLVSASRTCLVSQEYLVMLLCHPLVIESKETMGIFRKALLYQLHIDKRSGQWPSGAIHRNNSVYQNVAVRMRNNIIEVFTFPKHSWSKYRCDSVFSNTIATLHIITTNRALFCLYVQRGDEDDTNVETESQFYICCLTDSKWIKKSVSLTLTSSIFSAIAIGEFIYIVEKNKFWKLNLLSPTPVPLPDLPYDEQLCHLIHQDQRILAFYSVYTEKGVDETAVLCFDLSNNTWTRLNNLEGPADGMTSFKDDHSIYLLKSNGDIWKLVKPQSDIVDFELVAKLWRCVWELHGAVTFLDDLYIYGVKSETIKDDPQLLKSIGGLFRNIIYVQSHVTDYRKSTFVPFIVNRNLIGSDLKIADVGGPQKHNRVARLGHMARN